MTRKIAGRAIEQTGVLSQRQSWFGSPLDPEPERLVFIDET